MQQKFLFGVSAAFFSDVSQQSKTEHGSEHEMKNAYLYHRASARRHLNTTNKIMKKVLDPKKIEAGSKKSHEPRLLGSIVEEMLQGWNRNTELSVDLKTILRSDRKMKVGKEYQGVLRCDSEASIEDFRCRDAHYTFTETLPHSAGKRNPHVFDGQYITITRRSDGNLRLNFKELKVDKHFSVYRYALGVFNELMWALEDLVEK